MTRAPTPAPNSSSHAVLGSAALTLGGSALGAVLMLVNEAIAARILGAAGYGLYAMGMMCAKIGEIMALFGLPLAILHFLPVHLHRADDARAVGAIVAGAAAPLLLGSALAAALWAGAPSIAAALHQPGAAPSIALLGLAIPLMAMADMLGNLGRAFGRPIVHVAARNLALPLAFCALLLLTPGLGVPGAFVAASGAGAAIGLLLIARIVRRRLGWVRPDIAWRPLYRYAAPIAANAVFALAIVWTDLLLLGIYTDPATVGAYRACMLVVVAFDLVWNASSAATAPIYPVLIARNDRARLQTVYGAAIRGTALVALPLLAALAINGADVLGLLHPDFRTAAAALAIFAAGHAVKTTFGAASVLLVVGGSPMKEARNGALAAALNLGLNLVLVPRYGPIGAATATATALVALSALRCWQVRRLFGLVSLEPATLRATAGVAAGALLVAAGFMLAGAGPGAGPWAFALRLAILGAALAPALWWAGLSRPERGIVLGLLRRPRASPAVP